MAYWTDEEVGVLTDRDDLTAKDMEDLLPGRKASQITAKRAAVRSGVIRNNPEWTPEEDALILDNVGRLTNDQMSARLPGRTPSATKNRRRVLGALLPMGHLLDPFKPKSRTLLAKTCPSCGYMLPQEKFDWHSRHRSWESTCKYCQADEANDYRKDNLEDVKRGERSRPQNVWTNKAQELTKMTASRSGYPYLESDFEVLDDPKLTLLGKALKTDRTYHAVASACGIRGSKSRGIMRARDRAESSWTIDNPNLDNVDNITAMLKEEFAEAGVTFPVWDWDDEDLD